MRRATASILDTLLLLLMLLPIFFLVVWVAAIGPLCWTLRDGLGPDSVESHGAHAVARFLFTFYWGPVLVVRVALAISCLCLAWKVMSVEAEASKPFE